MSRLCRFLLAFVAAVACLLAPQIISSNAFAAAAVSSHRAEPQQETGFLNRKIEFHGNAYRFQVYLPDNYNSHDKKEWPIVLFLHGRGERGTEGMWQTQIGLPQAVRNHPDRWPAIIVMPQCPLTNYWTDPDMLAMAMATLDKETAEFHADPKRTYLTGLSMGGYGSWELARLYPNRWAAIAISSGGIFWSYAPERLQQSATLPAIYAKPLNNTPIWLFHGMDDTVVVPLQSEVMYEAVKKENGNIRLWLYKGLQHDCWTRAYNEPELPRWLLSQRLGVKPSVALNTAYPEERLVIPQHPSAIKLSAAAADAVVGDYRSADGKTAISIYRKGDQFYEKDAQGSVYEIAPESQTTFFFPYGSSISRLIVERDAQGRVLTIVLREDRREVRLEKRAATTKM